jgi:hypothetical protein
MRVYVGTQTVKSRPMPRQPDPLPSTTTLTCLGDHRRVGGGFEDDVSHVRGVVVDDDLGGRIPMESGGLVPSSKKGEYIPFCG